MSTFRTGTNGIKQKPGRFKNLLLENFGPAISINVCIGYFIVAVIGCVTIIAAFPSAADMKQAGPWVRFLFAVVFTAAGTGHLFLLSKYIKLPGLLSSAVKALTALAVSFAIFITGLLFFLLVGVNGNYLVLAAAAGFLFPSALQFSWKYCNSLFPSEPDKVWTLPVEAPEQTVSIFLNSVQVKLQLALDANGKDLQTFSLTVPGRLPVGEMFHRFITDKKEQGTSISLYDEEQRPYEWKFTLKREFGSRMLDPSLTLIQNQVSGNVIIIPERVSETMSTVPQTSFI
ncbi:MAG: TssN family type VI secretion system protein [Ferruginibacter sp.]